MYALENGALEYSVTRAGRVRSGVPYCFILDETYKVVMAGPSGGEDPLSQMYGADAKPDVLPGPIDRVVRALTAAWRSTAPASSASAALSDLQVTVAPLHGFEGRRIAVFVERVLPRP
jgi:hypothetical protein